MGTPLTRSASPLEAVPAGRRVRPCPVCRSVDQELLYEQRFEDFAAGSITNAYDVVACRACGMCFASGLPDEERFAEYYGQSSKYDLSAAGAVTTSCDVQRHREVAEFIGEHVVDRSSRILDVGTATGALLLALREIGFRDVHGVEPSPDAALKARESYGLDVIAGDARAARAWPDRFGVVSLVAVLEHLVDPGSALRETIDLLTADGLLYLLVPDAARFSKHVDAPYQQFSVEHINYFTLGSLKNLLGSLGLEVVAERANIVRPTDDAEGPGIEVLCRRTNQARDIQIDSDGVDDLRRYIARSAEREAGVLERIAKLAEDQRSIYVWGTGTNALHLLAASRLSDCNIVAFLDSNPHYAGRELAGRPVMVPTDVKDLDAPILVASAVSQTAIATAARTLFGPDVPLILMY